MRKDRIEERIVGIERDLRDLRSELRQEIEALASGLRDDQAALVEAMAGEIQGTMAAGYRQIAYGISIAGAEKRFRAEMAVDCPPGDTRDECIEHFVDEHLRRGVGAVDAAPPEERGAALAALVAHDEENSRRFRGTACEYCQGIYLAERDRLLGMERKFAEYRDGLSLRSRGWYYKQLPDDVAVSGIVEPLAHRGRFIMLKNLTSGSLAFKELGELTGYEGGHLVYHLNKLVDSGLVAKEETGLYRITDRGLGVMDVIRKMCR